MISTLPELIAPLTEAEFFGLRRNYELKFLPRSGENRFADMFDWATLRRLIESDGFAPNHLRITKNRKPVQRAFYSAQGKINPAMLDGLLKRGASLIANRLELQVAALSALCSDVKARVGERVRAGSIITTGDSGAFSLHFDPVDNIVIQLEGSKRWRIYDQPVAYPVKGMAKPAKPRGKPIFDQVLQPGDLLYVPSGFWHHCDNGPELSHHLGIVLRPATGWHALQMLMPEVLADDLFRMPLTRLNDAERAAHEAVLRARLIEKVRRMSMSLPELLAETEKDAAAVEGHED